jgi:L-iditol 2-dehydrogenase
VKPELPDTCRAAAVVKPGGPLEILDVKVPHTLEPGALLIKTDVATICATDVHLQQDAVATGGGAIRHVPVILGHEMTGRIVHFGDTPHTDSIGQPLALGDRIVFSHGSCGRCVNCVVEGEPTLCTNRRRYMVEKCTDYPYLTGGFAEYVYVFPTSGRLKVPDEISPAAASAASCAFRTVVHGFDRLGEIHNRQTVVVQGSGPLGLFAVALAATKTPRNLVVIGGPRRRLELAARWGATHTIDVTEVPDPVERRERVLEITAGRGADVVVEVSGVVAAFPEGMDLLRSGGRYLIVGQGHSETVPFNATTVVLRQLTLLGSISANIGHYWKALDFMRTHQDRFHWDDMISNEYPLERINEAFESMARWDEIKPAITFA